MRIHIIGFPVFVGGIARQLCAFCGERLMDDDWNNIATCGGGGPRFWPIGGLLRVDGIGKSVIEYNETEPIPVECCAYVAPVVEPPKLKLVKS